MTSREVGDVAHKFCRHCGTECVPVQSRGIQSFGSKSFFSLLPSVVVYPFRGNGWWILILSTIVLWALEFISAGLFSIFTKIVAFGYLFTFMQNIIHATASEEEELPGLPGLDDVGGGAFRLLGCVLMSFGIAIGLACYAIFGREAEELGGPTMIAAVAFGCLYFPMALLAVAMKDSFMASNPLVVLPAILKVPLEYLATVLLLGAVALVEWLGRWILESAFGPHPLTTHSMATLFAFLGARAFWKLTEVYLLTVDMRTLGLLYLTKKRKLGWFSR